MSDVENDTCQPVIDLNQLRRSCASCALHELCLPAGIGGDDLKQLDAAVRDKRTLERGASLYGGGDPFHALYVVRSGSLKTYVQDENGDMQVLGFHLPGEIVGVDALANDRHMSHAVALERSSICELPYSRLQQVMSDIPALSTATGNGTGSASDVCSGNHLWQAWLERSNSRISEGEFHGETATWGTLTQKSEKIACLKTGHIITSLP